MVGGGGLRLASGSWRCARVAALGLRRWLAGLVAAGGPERAKQLDSFFRTTEDTGAQRKPFEYSVPPGAEKGTRSTASDASAIEASRAAVPKRSSGLVERRTSFQCVLCGLCSSALSASCSCGASRRRPDRRAPSRPVYFGHLNTPDGKLLSRVSLMSFGSGKKKPVLLVFENRSSNRPFSGSGESA